MQVTVAHGTCFGWICGQACHLVWIRQSSKMLWQPMRDTAQTLFARLLALRSSSAGSSAQIRFDFTKCLSFKSVAFSCARPSKMVALSIYYLSEIEFDLMQEPGQSIYWPSLSELPPRISYNGE
jgi:hypothetical protein